MKIQNKYLAEESTWCNGCCGRKPTSSYTKYMKADSTAMVLITNHLSDATIQYRCCRLRNSADFMKFGRSWSNCVKVKSHSKNCKK